MADRTEAPPIPRPTERGLADQDDESTIELSDQGRTLIEETADLVVELPD